MLEDTLNTLEDKINIFWQVRDIVSNEPNEIQQSDNYKSTSY